MTMTLPDVDNPSRLVSGLEPCALASAFTASTFGASTFVASAFGSSGATGPSIDGSDIAGSGMECSDTGASAASLVSAAEAVTGSLDAPAEWETPALREPDSPPIGSGCWSLTVNSPLKIDHLVTFISCQILTWPRAYRKFRKWRFRFRRLVSAENLPRNPREEPAPGLATGLQRLLSRLTGPNFWLGEPTTTEKCINENLM